MDYDTAGKTHQLLNRRGYAFTRHDELCKRAADEYVLTDTYSATQRDSKTEKLHICVHIKGQTARVFAFDERLAFSKTTGRATALPKPLHEPVVVQFDPKSGHVAAANAIQREMQSLAHIEHLSGIESLA